MDAHQARRHWMVDRAIAMRGLRDRAVLAAMREVPRHLFVPAEMREFAYEDTPLPIGHGRAIAQPHVVARFAQELQLSPRERVLEIGAGTGYAAAVLSRLAARVDTVERHGALAAVAAETLTALGYHNVHVHHGEAALGLREGAPYDAIAVTEREPTIPEPLLRQLADRGRLLIAVGPRDAEHLVRVTKQPAGRLFEEDLGDLHLLPLVGREGWGGARKARSGAELSGLVREAASAFDDPESVDLAPLLERVGDARVVLLGESTHGASELQRMRARITRELVLRRGFDVVALEADWPDAARIDRYVRRLSGEGPFDAGDGDRAGQARAPGPSRSEELAELVEWLRALNEERPPERRVRVHGLDLYGLYTSASTVIRYLARIDPAAAKVARERYGGLTPWQLDPEVYGRAALGASFRSCEAEAASMLQHLFARRIEQAARSADFFLDEVGRARMVAGAEPYYRALFLGGRSAWNLRDQHLFDTLDLLLGHLGPGSRAVIWAHASRAGDAAATEMGVRGELNLGYFCRRRFRERAYLIGFGSDHGALTAAAAWGEEPQRLELRPAHPSSYEHAFHRTGMRAFLLPLRHATAAVRDELEPIRRERAIDLTYSPRNELLSHYFQASLPHQFDEYVWFDECTPLLPLDRSRLPWSEPRSPALEAERVSLPLRGHLLPRAPAPRSRGSSSHFPPRGRTGRGASSRAPRSGRPRSGCPRPGPRGRSG